LIGGQGENMKYHLVIGGPKSGGAFIAENLVDSLNLEVANSAILIPWGRYKNWKGKLSYEVANFQLQLADTLADNSQVQHVVIYGPGLVFNTLLATDIDLTTIFPTSQKYFVKRDLRATEIQMIADMLPTLETHKFLRRAQDTRISEFEQAWQNMVDDYFAKFDAAVQDYSFREFGNFIINQSAVTVNTTNIPENRTIRLALA
jgi:hypothetical protein